LTHSACVPGLPGFDRAYRKAHSEQYICPLHLVQIEPLGALGERGEEGTSF
jgi:hypothetical protein